MSETSLNETSGSGPAADGASAKEWRLPGEHELPDDVEQWNAPQVLGWTAQRLPESTVLTCSFGGGGIVLAHMVSEQRLAIPIIFLDTGFHFPETVQFKKQFAERFQLDVVDLEPELTVQQQADRHGPNLFATNPDKCCAMRKVDPLANFVHDNRVDAWISALRRDQSTTRKNLAVFEWHEVAKPTMPDDAGPAIPPRRVLKVHPLAGWTRQDVWRYIHANDLPYHPLLDQGYTSIGCAPCTAPASSSDERSGRWAGTGKVECGLHTFSEQKAQS